MVLFILKSMQRFQCSCEYLRFNADHPPQRAELRCDRVSKNVVTRNLEPVIIPYTICLF